MQVLALLFAGAFTYVTSLGAGKLLLQALRVKLYRSEERFFGFVLGSAILSTSVFVLTAAHLAYAGAFLTLGLAIVGAAVWCKAYRSSGEELPRVALLWRIGFGLLYAVFAVIYLRNALIPEISADAILYHIALPARYLREHCFPPSDRNMMANLSEGIEMLFLFAFAFGKHSAGAMVHLIFTLVLPFGMMSYGRRAGLPSAGAAAALLFFLSPMVGKLATVGYIDVAVAAVVFAVFYLLEIWREEQSVALLIAAGLLAGFCYAAKYTAGIAVLYALGMIVYRRLRVRQPLWRPVFLTGVCSFLMMVPYLAKNTIAAGNPLAPFANQLFPNPAMTVSLERNYAYQMRHWLGVERRQVPLEATVRGGLLNGVLGPVFLLTPLALLALRSAAGRRLLLASAVFTLPYFASIATRFLVPSLPLLAFALVCAVAPWRGALPVLVAAHAILSWPRVVPRYCDGCWRLLHVPWKSALRLEPEEDFLRSHISDYAIGRDLDKIVPPGQPVFALQPVQQAYHSHEIVVAWQSTFGHRLESALLAPVRDRLRPVWSHEYRFPPKAVRKIRLLQQGRSPEDQWSVSELRILRQDDDLPRASHWRLRASHNPWEIPWAFDNNPATRWSSGQPMRPGMWLEVDFGEEQNIDGVIAECTGDQDQTRMSLEYESLPDRWEALAGDPVVYQRRSPPGLRQAAGAALLQHHVNWMLVNDNDPIASDIHAHPEQWGARLAAVEREWRLYGFGSAVP